MAYFDSGCATRAFDMRRYLEQNNLPLNRFHSFQLRSRPDRENAKKAGDAWRLFLNGVDDFHTQWSTDGKGTSIPATAHKTIQQFEDEMEAYIFSIDATAEHGYKALSLVIDTYDPIRFIKYYAVKVAKHAKSKGVHLVFRPDSGHVRDQAFSLWCMMWSADLLKDTSCIIGESMTFDKCKEYDSFFKEMGCNLDWFNFGIGSGFANDITRDYLGFAMKTAYSNGGNRMKFSADKIKESIPGDIHVEQFELGGTITTVANYMCRSDYVILYDGQSVQKPYTWNYIKQRASAYLDKDLGKDCVYGVDVEAEQERLRKKYITDVTPKY